MTHIPLDSQDEAVKRFFLAMPVDPHGSILELNGQAIACMMPIASGNGAENGEWTEAKNNRRCDLIDREIEGTLSPAEAVELYRLQTEMLHYRRRIAPLPLDDARKLHTLASELGRSTTQAVASEPGAVP